MGDGISMQVATACLARAKTIAHGHAQRLLAAEKREEKKAKEAAKKTGPKKATGAKDPESAPKSKSKKERKEPKTEYLKRKYSFMDKYLDCNIDLSVPLLKLLRISNLIPRPED